MWVVGGKVVQPLWKIVWRLLKTLNIELSYEPTILPLDIYPHKTKALTQTCPPNVHCSHVHILAKTWKQRKCSLIDNGYRIFGIFIQWGLIQPEKE